MAVNPAYKCTRCGKKPGGGTDTEARDLLTVKKVSFNEMGVGGRTYKSRTVDWLCPECVRTDPDYIREKFVAPGNIPDVERVVG
jgi:hypothetical protein